jgi:hypothetical protein
MVEDTNIALVYAQLRARIRDYVDEQKIAPLDKVIQSRLGIIKDATSDAGNPFNAAEQIQSLQHAQKELELLRGDFLSLQVDGKITESQYAQLMHTIDECDECIRTMSDPEFS